MNKLYHFLKQLPFPVIYSHFSLLLMNDDGKSHLIILSTTSLFPCFTGGKYGAYKLWEIHF